MDKEKYDKKASQIGVKILNYDVFEQYEKSMRFAAIESAILLIILAIAVAISFSI